MVFAIQKANFVDIRSSSFRWYSFVFERTQSRLVVFSNSLLKSTCKCTKILCLIVVCLAWYCSLLVNLWRTFSDLAFTFSSSTGQFLQCLGFSLDTDVFTFISHGKYDLFYQSEPSYSIMLLHLVCLHDIAISHHIMCHNAVNKIIKSLFSLTWFLIIETMADCLLCVQYMNGIPVCRSRNWEVLINFEVFDHETEKIYVISNCLIYEM